MNRVSVALLVFLSSCAKEDPAQSSAPSGETGDVAKAEVPEPEPPSLAEQIEATSTAAEAFAFALPHMEDEFDKTSMGALLFTLWAAEHLRWSDVDVERDETSLAKVKKDADAERGKRMCYSGRIIQIARSEIAEDRQTFIGLLHTRRRDLIHFLAVGSTGELVEKSRARFCGFVTGRYSYANSGGGSSHAVQLAGMFKLPENTDDAR